MASESRDLGSFDITLYHMRPSRSTRVVWLLHELKAIDKVKIEKLNLMTGVQYQSSFRGMNSMSALPTAIVKSKDDGTAMTMTESSGICLWLTDMVPEAGLKPDRSNVFGLGQYYRFVTFAASSMDELLWSIRLNKQLLPEEQRAPAAAKGARTNFMKKVIPTLEGVLKGDEVEFICEPYHKGFTTADLMVGYALYWSSMYGLLADSPILLNYLDRMRKRQEFKAAFGEKASL